MNGYLRLKTFDLFKQQEEPDGRPTTTSTIRSLQQTTEDLKQLCHQKDKQLQELVKRNHKLQVSLEQAFQVIM